MDSRDAIVMFKGIILAARKNSSQATIYLQYYESVLIIYKSVYVANSPLTCVYVCEWVGGGVMKHIEYVVVASISSFK